jgi:hypothetical protein
LAAVCPFKPNPLATTRPWNGRSPRWGSNASQKIFSGCVAATSSMSIPSAADAMITTADVRIEDDHFGCQPSWARYLTTPSRWRTAGGPLARPTGGWRRLADA